MTDNQDEKKNVRKAVLENLDEDDKGYSLKGIESLQDVELDVRVEFSRIEKSVKEVLEIVEGDVIKLNRFAGELVDVFVDEKLLAKGEITVIDDRFGIRINEILPPEDRIG